MSVDVSEINYLAVVVAVVIQFAGGAAWYGIMSAPWLDAVGKTREEIPQGKSAMAAYLIALAGSVIGILGLAIVVQAAGADSLLEGLLLGFIAGIGFWPRPWPPNILLKVDLSSCISSTLGSLC